MHPIVAAAAAADRDDHDVAADNAYQNGTANPVDDVTYANRRCNGVQVS
jgi:hypothetical protein